MDKIITNADTFQYWDQIGELLKKLNNIQQPLSFNCHVTTQLIKKEDEVLCPIITILLKKDHELHGIADPEKLKEFLSNCLNKIDEELNGLKIVMQDN